MTEIHVLLDKSGSMRTIKDDSIGGYNEFLDLQKASENADTIYWSLSTFNNNYENEFSGVKVNNVQYLKNDDIFVKCFKINEVRKKMEDGKILNGLTLIALQWFFLNFYGD